MLVLLVFASAGAAKLQAKRQNSLCSLALGKNKQIKLPDWLFKK